VGWLGPALAADPACAPTPVEIDPRVRAQWPELAGRIKGALHGRRDVDPCARITIRLSQGTIILEVVLPDGRSASRSLSRGEDVVPTLEALLLLPAAPGRSPDAEAPRAAKPVDVVAQPTAPGASTIVSVAEGPAADRGSAPFHLEFSLAAGVRTGDGQGGLALGALTFFDLGGWLLGFEGVAARYQAAIDGEGAQSLELCVLGGRRFRFEHASIDVTAGPALALRGIGSQRVSAMAGSTSGQVPPPTSDGPWARLLGGARVNFRTHSLVRTFAGVEGEVALERWSTPVPTAEPRLPPWVVGLVFGGTVGTP